MAYANRNLKLTGASAYEIDIQNQITEAFRVFDEHENGIIELKKVSIIVRALGRVPRTAEIQRFMEEVEDPDSKGSVKLETLILLLKDILMKDRWKPASQDQLLRAFQFFDNDHTGYLSVSFLKKLLTENGDKFNDEEINRMLSIVTSNNEDKIEYAKLLDLLVVPKVIDIFECKRKILAEKRDS